MSQELKPCPFCGGNAYIEQTGNRRQSTIYECGSCGCRLETGEEFNHGKRWNERAESEEITRLREVLARTRNLLASGYFDAAINCIESVLPPPPGEKGMEAQLWPQHAKKQSERG